MSPPPGTRERGGWAVSVKVPPDASGVVGRVGGRVPPVVGVGPEEVQRLAEPCQRGDHVAAGVDLGPLAASPEHVGPGAELGPEVDGRHRLLDGVGADGRVGVRERAVAEGGVREQVRRRHRDDEPSLVERLAEAADDPVALGRRGVEGDEVVVVQVDAVGAEVGQEADGVGGVDGGPGRLAERVAPYVADGPEPEREPVGGGAVEDGVGGHRVTRWRGAVLEAEEVGDAERGRPGRDQDTRDRPGRDR